MSLTKRGKFWHLSINGIRESTGKTDRAEAEAVHDVREKQIASGMRSCVMFEFAMNAHQRDRKDGLNFRSEQQYAEWWIEKFAQRELHSITAKEIELLGEEKMRERTKSTANHYLAFLKTFFNITGPNGSPAIDRRGKGWIENVPKINLYKRLKNERKRSLNLEEYTRLMAELPEHLKVMVDFSIETGLRQGNVSQLKWKRVDLLRRTVTILGEGPTGERNKNGEEHIVHLTDRALAMLQGQVGKHSEYVFVYEKSVMVYGKPVKKNVAIRHVNNGAWKNALDRAGIKDFRWHDLRHTFATNHASSGTPIPVLKEMGGWKSLAMVMRYANISAEAQKPYLGNAGFKAP